MYKIALWGIGEGYNLFTQLQGHEKVNVVVIVDNKTNGVRTIDNIPVIAPAKLVESEYLYDYLVVSVIDDGVYKIIVNQAEKMGIPREIILPLRIFQIPFFNFEDYIKIKKSNISIISDYCFAGFLYHKFGMRFTSPTINMFIDNDCYFQFISNLDYYMKKPMVEVKNPVDETYKGIYAFQRGRIEDIEFMFNHDETFSNAAARWQRGVKRFNWDNYIVTMTIRSDKMAQKFNDLPIKHKIGFYWKDLGLDSVVYTPEWNEVSIRAKFNYDFAGLVNRAADDTCGFRYINWMKALLHQEGFKRVY